MKKQETEMKWKLEMEIGNGNWKWKLEMEMGTKNALITGAMFLHSVLSHYSSILLSNGYRTDFMSCVLPLLLFGTAYCKY